jgi:hypothetical protein
MRGKRVVIPGLFNRTGAFGVRFMPRRVLTRIVRSINTSLLRRSRES